MHSMRNVLAVAGPAEFTPALVALMLLVRAGLSMAAPPDAVVITAADAGRTVSLVVGEKLTVTLDAQPGTGFRWEPAATSTSLLSLSGTTPGGASIPGAVETQSFAFVARSAGAGNLTLVYRRAWGKNAVPSKSFSVAIRIAAQ